MDAHDILIRPMVTEKSAALMQNGAYTFVVDKRATKTQISQAVADIFKVTVAKVNTMNVEGKKKRVGRTVGKRSDFKKAIVTLAPGQTIQFFET